MTLLAQSLFLVLLAGAGVEVEAHQRGDRVLAKWPADGLWYPARVQSVDADGLKIAFDDGDLLTLSERDLRAIDWRVGTRVSCNWQNKGRYFGAKIAAIKGEAIEIAYDDGDREQATISRCRAP